MPLDRRQFLGTALPLALPLMALGGDASASASDAGTAPPKDMHVFLVGDAAPCTQEEDNATLARLTGRHPKALDSYLGGGAVAELEARFCALLGKEEAVFMPTGTLANHIAIRILCGEAKHALVQQESHVYRDESDAVTTLSGINLVPLAAGRAAPTLGELEEAIKRAEIGPYPLKVGALSIESPVRRAQGATVSPALMADVLKLARAKQIPLHLDGARLFFMCGSEGFDLKRYCASFDTVYVSLYKYLGAPFGAILAGPKPMMRKARELRHIFGGTVRHAWQAALPALEALDDIEERYAAVRRAGDQLLSGLDAISGFKVERIEHASNIALLTVSAQRLAGLEERLMHAQIKTRTPVDGKIELNFNESLLRRDTGYLLSAFAGSTA
ncbi:MAG: beta-eliminating lyase-related protein [Pseudomonadota bacterium]